jgi:hypothetical protein
MAAYMLQSRPLGDAMSRGLVTQQCSGEEVSKGGDLCLALGYLVHDVVTKKRILGNIEVGTKKVYSKAKQRKDRNSTQYCTCVHLIAGTISVLT